MLIHTRYCLIALLAPGLSCLSVSAFAMEDSLQDGYSGQWVMKFGQRNFMVLTLKVQNGNTSGSLRRPEHFQMTGVSASRISSASRTLPIVRGSVKQGKLHFVTQNPSDKTDEDEFEMVLTSHDQALIKPAEYPADSLILQRVSGSEEIRLATDWEANRSYLQDDSDAPNAEMKKIFDEDQRVRQDMPWKEGETKITRTDAERREATRKLLVAGVLHTCQDFARAAFVYQHGDNPEDYLFAHSLAVIAVSKGDSFAVWIAAATLDRYLQSTGKPQIYGTQFLNKGDHWAQEPYNRDLISDALRRHFGVPSMAVQQEQLNQYNAPPAK
jgi:hypothetical protein